MSNKAWEEIGYLIADGFTGLTYSSVNIDDDGDLVFHAYTIGDKQWLTIKHACDGDVNTVDHVGNSVNELYDFIGKILNKK